MTKKFLLFLIAVLAAFGQSPSFEVVSIRPAAPMTPDLIRSGKLRFGLRVEGGRAEIGFVSLRDLVFMAYEVKPFQVKDLDWMADQRFDITAKLPEGGTKEQVPAMLKTMLKERFKLNAHSEKREQNVYALEVAKGGHKMKDAPAPQETPAPEGKPEPKADMVLSAGDQTVRINRMAGGAGGQTITATGGANGAQKMTMGPNGEMHMEMERVTMTQLVQMLSAFLDRPAVDRTELTGSYQLTLDLTMADMMQAARASGRLGAGAALPPALAGAGAGAGASDPGGGSIFASVQKLGLRLEKQKTEMEFVIVDSAEKVPTEN